MKNFQGKKVYSFEVDKNKSTIIILNLLSLVFLIGALAIMIPIINIVRPAWNSFEINSASSSNYIISIILSLPAVLVLTIVHEAFHGVVFFIFSKEIPKFGFKIWYAYAAAPEWFFPRYQYLISALCPLFAITILGTLLLTVIPLMLITPLIIIVAGNIGGSIGDLYMALRVLMIRAPLSLVNDWGKGMAIFI